MINFQEASQIPSSLLCMCCFQICDIPFTCKICRNLICFICLFNNQNCCLICYSIRFKRVDPIILSVLLKIQCQCNYCGQFKNYLKFINHNFVCDILSNQLKLDENFSKQLYATYENCTECMKLLTKHYKCKICSKQYCQNCLNYQKQYKTVLKCQEESLQCNLIQINQYPIKNNQNALICLQCNQLVHQYNLHKHLKACQIHQKHSQNFSNNQQDIEYFRFPELIFNYKKFSQQRKDMEVNQLRRQSILVDKRMMLQYHEFNEQKLELSKQRCDDENY